MRGLFDFTRKIDYNREHGSRGVVVLNREKLLDGVLLLMLLGAACLLVYTAMQLSAVSSEKGSAAPVLIIDPGHGGIDGGAIAFDGTKESDINLAIALKLSELAGFCGVQSVLTRTDDSARTSYEAYSEHADLVYRTELANSIQNGVFLSIHQNFYPTSQPSGAQVLYAPGEQSRQFAEALQTLLVSQLQPSNRRLAEPAPKSLYLTAHVSCPAVLVECGFLSNLTDLDQLRQDTFQSSLAVVLLGAYLRCFGQTRALLCT